jgi:hypothetical protein
LSSFAARLNREGLIDGTKYAIHCLCVAFEEENATEEDANNNISVASEWIIRSGLQLYLEARNTVPQMQMTEFLYNYNSSSICLEHWQFWKLRFSEVMDKVDEEAAKMAQRAIDRMEWIEKNIGKRRDLDLYTGDRPLKSRKTAV